MKHKIILVLSFVIFGAVTAFAGGVPEFSDTAKETKFTFIPSNNVSVAYTTDADEGQIYALGTKQKAGNRFYISSNDNSNIFYKEDADYIGSDVTHTDMATAVPESGKLVSTDWKSQ